MFRQLENELKVKAAIERLLEYKPQCARKGFGYSYARDAIKSAKGTDLFDDPYLDANTKAYAILAAKLNKTTMLLSRDPDYVESCYVYWKWHLSLLQAVEQKEVVVDEKKFIEIRDNFFKTCDSLGKCHFGKVFNEVSQKMDAKRIVEGFDRDCLIGAVIAILLIAGAFSMPYWYYSLLRFVATFGFCAMAFFCFLQEKKILMSLALGLAFLFNPLYPVYMAKSSWVIWDVIAGLYTLYLTYNLKNKV